MFCLGDSTKKFNRFLIEINSGFGRFFLGKPVPSDDHYNQYTLSQPLNGSVGFSYNFDLKKGKYFSRKFLGVGGGLSFMTYQYKHTFSDYQDLGKTYTYTHEFSQHDCLYRTNTLSYCVYLSKGTLYASGFFVRNNFGLCINTYVNKQNYNYIKYTSGSSLIYDPSSPNANQFGYFYSYSDKYEIVTEKNYSKISYSAFYSLNFGLEYKKIIYYAAPELFILNNQLNSVIKIQGGIIFLL